MLHLWLFVVVNCLFSILVQFHLSLIILCLCGLVSPPLLLFIISLLCPFQCFSGSTFPVPAIFPTFFSPPPTLPLFLLILLFFSSLFLPPHCLSPPPLQLPFYFSSPFFYTPHHLSLLPAPSGISLWRWIWSRCVSTAMNACRTTWNAGWPSVNATQKRRWRNWYPSVCDPLFLLSPHFHCSSFGQFPSSFLSVSIFCCFVVNIHKHASFRFYSSYQYYT